MTCAGVTVTALQDRKSFRAMRVRTLRLGAALSDLWQLCMEQPNSAHRNAGLHKDAAAAVGRIAASCTGPAIPETPVQLLLERPAGNVCCHAQALSGMLRRRTTAWAAARVPGAAA